MDFLGAAASCAVACEQQTGCPAELSVAQAILESAWGTHCPGNNLFGIKATDSSETYEFSKEYLNGQWVTMLEAFEAYPSFTECFIAHAKLIEGGPYAPAWVLYRVNHNLDNLIRGIAIHYATDPNYAAEIIQLANGPHITAAIVAARNALITS